MEPRKPVIYEADLASDFQEDPHNANRGTERGHSMLEKSIGELGAARSIVADANGFIPAGNKTRDALIAAGMTKAIVIETDGRTPVVVKRTDWDLGDKKSPARRYAYFDNRVAQVDLEWDVEQLRKDLDDGVSLKSLWSDDELIKLLGATQDDGSTGVTLAERFVVPPFTVLDAKQGYWQERKRAWVDLGIRSEAGRGEDLLSLSAAEQLRAKAAKSFNSAQGNFVGEQTEQQYAGSGTSIFDPVLCEIAYRWFAPSGGGGTVLDPFAGGSVRGVTAALLGQRYYGIDLRPEQVRANERQWREISGVAATPDEAPEPREVVTDLDAVTPVEERGGILFKRDDLFELGGANGTKVRAIAKMLASPGVRGPWAGLVACGARQSTQVARAAQVAQALGLPCRVHTASGPETTEIAEARAAGAEVIQHKPGHLSVIKARARDDAKALGWLELPFGLQCDDAIETIAAQVANLPADLRRLVVPVGGGATLAGVLRGLERAGRLGAFPILGVMIGGDPKRCLDEYAPQGWKRCVELVKAKQPYEQEVADNVLHGVILDPVYEAKAIPFLEQGDCLWIVGCRTSALEPRQQASAIKLSKDVVAPTWITGNSVDLDALLPEDVQADLVFSCPPYYDLEHYSEDPADLSNLDSYEDFVGAYREIIARAVGRLKPNRFAVFVVGDLRGKDGCYRGFVVDTIRAFEDAGAHLYNEAVLLTPIGTLPMRTAAHFPKSRKLGKTHQNVLVFYKGDTDRIRMELGSVDVALPDPEVGGDA